MVKQYVPKKLGELQAVRDFVLKHTSIQSIPQLEQKWQEAYGRAPPFMHFKVGRPACVHVGLAESPKAAQRQFNHPMLAHRCVSAHGPRRSSIALLKSGRALTLDARRRWSQCHIFRSVSIRSVSSHTRNYYVRAGSRSSGSVLARGRDADTLYRKVHPRTQFPKQALAVWGSGEKAAGGAMLTGNVVEARTSSRKTRTLWSFMLEFRMLA